MISFGHVTVFPLLAERLSSSGPGSPFSGSCGPGREITASAKIGMISKSPPQKPLTAYAVILDSASPGPGTPGPVALAGENALHHRRRSKHQSLPSPIQCHSTMVRPRDNGLGLFENRPEPGNGQPALARSVNNQARDGQMRLARAGEKASRQWQNEG